MPNTTVSETFWKCNWGGGEEEVGRGVKLDFKAPPQYKESGFQAASCHVVIAEVFGSFIIALLLCKIHPS